MKLLIISNNLNRAGFKQRIGVHLETLQANGIDCEVVELPPGPVKRYMLFRRTAQFDGVLLHKKGLNLLNAICLRRYAAKIIYHFDDAIMYRDKDPTRYSAAHFKPWKRSVESADKVIVSSSYLAEHAGKFNAYVTVLHTAVKTDDYKFDDPQRSADGKIRLVWIGSKSTLGYLAELKPILETIGSLFDNTVLRIIGDEFFELKNMPVEKVQWEQRTRGLKLVQCDIGLAPLPDNPFTQGKCSFKVLEYAAAGLPAVASPVGTNPDHIVEGESGFLVNSQEAWIDRISELVKNAELRKRMGQQAKEIAGNYDITVIGQKFAQLIKQAIQ